MSNAHGGDYYAVVLMLTAGRDHGLLKLHGLWDGPCKTFSRIQSFFSAQVNISLQAALSYFQKTVSFPSPRFPHPEEDYLISSWRYPCENWGEVEKACSSQSSLSNN